jgi:arylsulfatase A-like enzyme/Flp pilus assembly protein TadD
MKKSSGGPGRSATRTRALVLGAAALLAAAAVLVAPRLFGPPARGASVLLVTLDTLRADHIGAYGDGDARTPALDGLARRGLLFEDASASVPLTLPSHATILSGLEPPRHGVHDNGTDVFPDEPPTLATLLQAQGYATAAFVGAYVLDRRFGLGRGFDDYDDRIDRREEGGVLESERRCEAVAEAAEAWLASRTGPFFAWAHFYDVHAPYDPPPAYRDQHPGRAYDGEVSYADACLGRVLAAAERGAGGRLLVAVLADHGEGLGDHGEKTHGFFVYQSTLRIPMILVGPGVPEGKRRPGLARTADVLPTLLGRLGVAPPRGLDGIDLLSGAGATAAYAETLYPRTFGWAPLHAWRRGSLKLVDAPQAEVYDLASDPGEARNLLGAGASRQTAEAETLRRDLAAFRRDERTGRAVPPDAETAERLRALGYAASASPPTPAGRDLLDPKAALPRWQAFEESTWAETRGETEAAIAALGRLVDEEPANPVFRRSLAAALGRAGRARESVAVLADLARIAPDDAVAWHERAVALARAGNVAEAVRSEAEAIARNPRLPEPHNHLGILEAGRGRLAEALRAFETATTLDPNNAKAWNNRANALRALGRGSEAEDAYHKAAERAPRDPDPPNGLGVLAVQAGRLDEAVAHFEKAVALDPAFAEARLNLAVARMTKGDAAAARGDLELLLRGRPDPDTRRKARELMGALPR